jgi:hypothetical protein
MQETPQGTFDVSSLARQYPASDVMSSPLASKLNAALKPERRFRRYIFHVPEIRVELAFPPESLAIPMKRAAANHDFFRPECRPKSHSADDEVC